MITKEFKSCLKLPGGSEIQKCYYPFKMDTYGRGCSNNCLYCYARSVLFFRKLWDYENPAVSDITKVELLLDDVLVKGKTNRKYNELLLNRIPLRLGGMTDCFGDIEKKHRVTKRLLKILDEFSYPYLILTKNKLITEYKNLLNPELAYIQFSITTPFDDIGKTYEPNASLTSERLLAARELTDAGFYVAGRINPLFPKFPDGYYSDGFRLLNDDKGLRYFDWNLIDMMADSGIQTVIAGFLRLSSWNIRWIKEATGEDLNWLFDSRTKQKNTALHFSTEEKRYYYERIQALCSDRGMEFSVCYDGDDAYEEFRYLWANKNDCCNGVGKVKGFVQAYDFGRKTLWDIKDRK